MNILISDKMVQMAFDWLKDNAGKAAQAKAARIRAEHGVKKAKAHAFLAAEGTVAEREAKAIASDDYDEAADAECQAIEQDEFYRNQKDKAIAIIEAWRSEQANLRALGKVG